jgi:DNA-binding GntR family transcriptional regulator
MKHKKFLTSNEVYEDLCIKIETLEYMPGDSISENDLSDIYGVSRHTIRNAIMRLKERRLLTVYPQRGTFVSLIDMEYVKNILFLRECLEQEVLAQIMELDDEKRNNLVVKLEKNLQEQKENVEKNLSIEEFNKLNHNFHWYLTDAIDRRHVREIIKEPYIHVRRWRNFEISSTYRQVYIVDEHQGILGAIKNIEKEKGRELLHTHLDTVTKLQNSFKNVEHSQYFIFR